MLSLAIDTSTKNCSVALYNNNRLLQCINYQEDGYAHSEKLIPLIQDIVENQGLKTSDINNFVISNGPGSYTGLRIGASAIKGLAYINQSPVITISSLEVLYHQAILEAKSLNVDIIFTMIDARRDEVYLAIYDRNGKLIEEEKSQIINEEFLNQYQDQTILLCGDGSVKFQDKFSYLPNIKWSSVTINKIDSIGDVIVKKVNDKQFADLAYFEPNYIKSYQPGKKKKLFS